MKKLFVRVGTMVEFTDEEYDLLINNRLDNDTMLELIKKGTIDGDTYIPQDQYEIDFEMDDEYAFCF